MATKSIGPFLNWLIALAPSSQNRRSLTSGTQIKPISTIRIALTKVKGEAEESVGT